MKIASTASWDTNLATAPKNVGTVHPHQMKQKDMSSQVLTKTDYSGYAQLNSKRIEIDPRKGKVNAGD